MNVTSRSQGGVGNVKIALMSDKGGGIARSFGCFNITEGVAFRGLYIVDKKMKIRHIRKNKKKFMNSNWDLISFLTVSMTWGLVEMPQRY